MDVPVVRVHPETQERHVDLLKWGLVPFNTRELKTARKPINARSETVAMSPMFRAAFAKRRCIVPATAFYEWKADPGGKQPFAIARSDDEPLAFAGVWEGWRSPDGEVIRTFAVLTTAENAMMSTLHHRMPVILERGDWATWLGMEQAGAEALMRPSAETTLKTWPVSKAVGNVRNDGAELLVPYWPAEHADGGAPVGSNLLRSGKPRFGSRFSFPEKWDPSS